MQSQPSQAPPRDALSEELFGSRRVTFAYGRREKAPIQRLERHLFNRTLRPVDYVELVGAPGGSAINITLHEAEVISVETLHTLFKGPQYRYFQEVEGDLIIYNESFTTKETGKGIGTRVFARQVEFARRFGVKQIETIADGRLGDSNVGYYVWPRLGFNMPLNWMWRKLDEAGFYGVEDTHQLFNRPGGRFWWYTSGSGGDAVFDLQDGSESLKCYTTISAKSR